MARRTQAAGSPPPLTPHHHSFRLCNRRPARAREVDAYGIIYDGGVAGIEGYDEPEDGQVT